MPPRHLLTLLLSLLLVSPSLWASGADGDVVVGKVADSHSVTDNGQFTYTMPLAVASGTGGMSPKLSIAYSSSNSTGLMGHGFDLQGLSTISRAPRNLFNDGKDDIIALPKKGGALTLHIGDGLDVFTGYNPTGTVAEANVGDGLVCWYDYDGNNCLMHKYDEVRNNEEFYDYDAENRLTAVTTLADGQEERVSTVEYDAGGNVTSKSGVGVMAYGEGTNRLEIVTGYALPEWEKVSYTSFHKVSEVIAQRGGKYGPRYFLNLTYGPDKTRCMQSLYPPSVTGSKYDEKYYVGNLYDEAHNNGHVLTQDYIYADGRLVAIHQADDRGERMRYVHLDHLGSVWAMTDDGGDIVAEYNYDPWGLRRDPATWARYDSYEQQGAAMDRGFGGHEQLDILDMVNMGGRMYDPHMGRFLTPDPYVQAPDNTQSLNRYAYCLNNPLSLTDPTGYSWLGSFFSAAVGIAVGVETFGIGSGVWGAMVSGACAGASSALASTLMNGANLWTATKSAFVGGCWGALGGAVNYGVGEIGGGWLARVSLHSVADGAMEALQGGHWEHGLMTGLVSAGGGELLSGYGTRLSDAQMLAGTAILGGVVSEIGGGKFANGAMTAAFQMMYNHFSHPSDDDDEGGSYTAKVLPVAIACSVADGPLPIGDAAGLVMTAGAVMMDAAAIAAVAADVINNYKQRIYVTYTLTNPQTSQVYIGRTSGVGTPEQLVLKRYYGHLFRRSQGFRNPRVDKWSRSRDAIRGREQQLIDF